MRPRIAGEGWQEPTFPSGADLDRPLSAGQFVVREADLSEFVCADRAPVLRKLEDCERRGIEPLVRWRRTDGTIAPLPRTPPGGLGHRERRTHMIMNAGDPPPRAHAIWPEIEVSVRCRRLVPQWTASSRHPDAGVIRGRGISRAGAVRSLVRGLRRGRSEDPTGGRLDPPSQLEPGR